MEAIARLGATLEIPWEDGNRVMFVTICLKKVNEKVSAGALWNGTSLTRV